MTFSYSGITNYGKTSLPSVDSWNSNMNILRDPPKAITTRRIDKVGQTSSITELIDESGDRSCEVISLYARGVNPCVSVDYSNNGNNGGQRSNGCSYSLNSGQAYLPYRIIKDGAFRPNITTPFNSLPLSRMPRTNTEAFSKKGFSDFTKKIMCPGGNYRGVKEDNIKGGIRPTATFRMDAPLVEPFEVKYVIKNPIKFDTQAGVSGVRTQDITTQNIIEPTKEINKTPVYAENVYANHGSKETLRYLDNLNIDTDRYLQDTLHSSVQSKKSKSIQITPIEDIMNVDIHTKDAMNISYTPVKTGHMKEDYVHNDVELQRRVLTTNVATNKHRNIYSKPEVVFQSEQKRNRPIAQVNTNHNTIKRQNTMDLTEREYKLKPTINAGGMTGRAQMPLQQRTEEVNITPSVQNSMNKKVLEMQIGRWK